MSDYEDILNELKQQFSRIGDIQIDTNIPNAQFDSGRLISDFTNKMIERASVKLYASVQEREFAKAIGTVMERLKGLDITITVTEPEKK